MIYKLSSIANTRIEFIPKIKPSGKILYITILCLVIGVLLALPFVYVDISVKSPGITRPTNERTDLRSTTSGIIDSIFFGEGKSVKKEDIILRVKHPEPSRFQQQGHRSATDTTFYDIKAPVSGVVMNISSRYAGGPIQANETFCAISPETDLIAECYVLSKDVGQLKLDQEARFQIEAFDYNYYGVLTGKIISIANDFSIVDNAAIFKVKCSFDSTKLSLKNGTVGMLKKGMNFQARFIVTKRSLWQLLYDTLDDWFNPSSPSKKNNKPKS